MAEVLNAETQTLLAAQAELLPSTHWWLGASDEENVSIINTLVKSYLITSTRLVGYGLGLVNH